MSRQVLQLPQEVTLDDIGEVLVSEVDLGVLGVLNVLAPGLDIGCLLVSVLLQDTKTIQHNFVAVLVLLNFLFPELALSPLAFQVILKILDTGLVVGDIEFELGLALLQP